MGGSKDPGTTAIREFTPSAYGTAPSVLAERRPVGFAHAARDRDAKTGVLEQHRVIAKDVGSDVAGVRDEPGVLHHAQQPQRGLDAGLRGRVGRGEHPGLCLLVTEAEGGSVARERVEAVAATLDGFELAEVDLELRGEGDVLGDAQSGARSSLRLLRVVKDADIIAEARIAAEHVLADDPALDRHAGLAAALERSVGMAERAALAKN